MDIHPKIMGNVTNVTASGDSIAIGEFRVQANVQGNIHIGHQYRLEVHNNHGVIVYPDRKPVIISRSVKSQPPRPPRGFVGREKESALLVSYISRNESVLLQGMEGLGKTTLAKKVANSDPAREMPDGVIFMEAVDENGKLLGYQDIVQLLFDALYESDPPSKVTHATAKVLLSNTRPLVVLDRFELPLTTLKDFPDLFPNGSILVTSRNPALDDTFQIVNIEPLPHEDAIRLLEDKTGIPLDEASRLQMRQICDLVENVPLAIVVIANILRNGRADLKTISEKIEVIRPPSRDKIQAAVERSYGLAYILLNKEERDILAHAAFAPGVSVDRGWLESMEGGKTAVESLEALGLLQANSPRLRPPEGMKQVVQSSRRDAQSLRGALLQHLSAELRERSLDFQFVEEELGNILGLVHWAAEENRWSDVVALGRAVDPFLTLKGLWDAWENVLRQILAAGQNLRDQAVEAWALHQLGSREIGVGGIPEAIKFLIRALRIRESIGDMEGFAYTLHNLRLILPPDRTGKSDKSIWERAREFLRGRNPWKYLLWLIPAAILLALVSALLTPRVSLAKCNEPMEMLPKEPSETISFCLIMENTGFVPVRGTTNIVADKELEIECGKLDTLKPGESLSCQATYVVTEEDLAQGSITSEARVEISTREGSKPVASEPITVTVILQPSVKEITLEISSDTNPFEEVGQPVNYTYEVTNTGNQPLEGTVFVDNGSVVIICTNTPEGELYDDRLDSGEAVSCTDAYSITQADINNGFVSHTAIAAIEEVETKDELTLEARQVRELELSISVNPLEYDAPNQIIAYTYEISNTGNVSLPGRVMVSDESASCPDSTTTGNFDEFLDPGETVTCDGEYAISQADIDNGSVTKTVTARAGDFLSEPKESTIHALQHMSLRLAKSASPTTYTRVGQTITYTYEIRNSGNTIIGPAQFYVTDEKIRGGERLPCGNEGTRLAPNETLTCTAVYTITQADFGPRSVTNTARALAEFRGSQIASEPTRATITCPYPPRGWISYRVRAGNTLTSISAWYNDVTVESLQQANCLGSSSQIVTGQSLYIPRLPAPGEIRGVIFEDPNGNRSQDSGERGAPNVAVALLDFRTKELIDVKITDSGGEYIFANLFPGEYEIFQIYIPLDPGVSVRMDFGVIPAQRQ